MFGLGVGIYFALPVEPPAWALPAGAAACALCLALAWIGRGGLGPLALLLAAAIAGAVVAQAQTRLAAGPVLGWRYHGPVEGRIVAVDRSASGAVRLTLDQVRLDRLPPDRIPRRVRISLYAEQPSTAPVPGTRVVTTAFLSPPAGPSEPGGFDFQRHAWFLKIGAVGYTRVPILRAVPPEPGMALGIQRLRQSLSDGLRARMPGQVGAVAVAITTGDRSGLSPEVTESLRASNLAHLLAISGLHMGLLVGFVFWTVRGGLALFPGVALTRPTRIWAALVALPFAAAYLLISGGSVATQRAFVMAAVMLGAICLGRRAVSLRSVAIAALIVLILYPSSLTGPGFQMSFAATGALVVVFGTLARNRSAWLRGWRGAVVSLVVSSAVAGLATAPFAALHFNRIGQFGLLANLLTVPLMGTLVMPLLLLGLLLWPLGLEGPAFALAGAGISWILLVSDWIANLPGAVRGVAAPPEGVLGLLGLGFALTACLVGRWRSVGLAVCLAGFLVWGGADRPVLLISDDGRLVGRLGPDGRHLSRERGVSFVADSWLENDGDMVDQGTAALRSPAQLGPSVIAVRRKADAEAALLACREGWIVLPMRIEDVSTVCRRLDPDSLATTGAIAVHLDGEGGWTERHAREVQGDRPWRPDR
jgi:competence protein ComEC